MTDTESRSEFWVRAKGAMRFNLAKELSTFGWRTFVLALTGSTSLYWFFWDRQGDNAQFYRHWRDHFGCGGAGYCWGSFRRCSELDAVISVVLGYNMSVDSLKKLSRDGLGASGFFGTFLAQSHFRAEKEAGFFWSWFIGRDHFGVCKKVEALTDIYYPGG